MDADLTPKKKRKATGVPFTKNDPRINKNGRPLGSLSVIGRLKQMFEEDPKDFEKFVKGYKTDPQNRKHITEMIDGKPRQPMDHSLVAEITVNLVKYGDRPST